jgi:hypothetical protein
MDFILLKVKHYKGLGFVLDVLVVSLLIGTSGIYANAEDMTPPSVVSTSPAHGATGVSTHLQSVSITFSNPMRTGYSISSNFPKYSTSWSSDRQTITLTRDDAASSLAGGITYSFLLNGSGSTSFRDFSGIPLEEYTFSFTTMADYELVKIPANDELGFHWPYYLSIPHALSEKTVLLVEPNNTGGISDDPSVHEQAAENLAKWRSSFAVDLDVPLLVPTFPRPATEWFIYTHALDRDSLLTPIPGLERIDLQLIAMIKDAQQRLETMGYDVSDRVFINGYSASGSFVNRFTLLHPEIVQAAAIGSPGGWPTVPVSEWQQRTLTYPVGIADLATLIGKGFDVDTFRRVPQYIYVGNMDDNDAVDFSDGFDQVDRELIDDLFGDGAPYIAERWPHAEEIFDSVQSAAQFVIYPGVAHSITPEMFDDIKAFFEMHRAPAFSLADVISVIQVLSGTRPEDIDLTLDINGDSQIGAEDAICLLHQICGLR